MEARAPREEDIKFLKSDNEEDKLEAERKIKIFSVL